MSRKQRAPSYRLHKPFGQAVVTLDGRDLYLGPHGTEESRRAYDRAVAEWLQNGRRLPAARGGTPDLVVAELAQGYLEHVAEYYVKDGVPTSEQASIACALRPLTRLYMDTSEVGGGRTALNRERVFRGLRAGDSS